MSEKLREQGPAVSETVEESILDLAIAETELQHAGANPELAAPEKVDPPYVRKILACRTERGYSLAARIIKRTDKGVLVSNDTDELWLPAKHVFSATKMHVHISHWIGQRKSARLVMIDPNGIDNRIAADADLRYLPRFDDYDGDGVAP